jgi:hypothetical protein
MNTSTGNRPRSKPPKIPITLLIPLIFLAVLYAFVQPWVNARFGLKLPSLGQVISSTNSPAQKPEKSEADKSSSATANAPKSGVNTKDSTASKSTNERSAAAEETDTTDDSPYSILKSSGSEVYVSEAGLRYTRGSEEGHRIKHLERHLQDMPNRSGNHGVFAGTWRDTLGWIDEAYRRSREGDSKTKVRKEDNRSVIETEFSNTIGYVGGREGGKQGKPPTRRLRLVVEGDRFITAFPY